MRVIEVWEAKQILERWVQFGRDGWDRHDGYLLVAHVETDRDFNKRAMELSPWERQRFTRNDIEPCSLTMAKRMVHASLLLLGADKGRGDWVLPYWKHFRKHGAPGEDAMR